MAVTSRDIIKQWFQTNDYPTQEQFWSFIDSMFHVNDTIGIENVTNLTTALQGKVDYEYVVELLPTVIAPSTSTPHYNIPAGGKMIRAILVKDPADININIGTSPGASDIAENMPVRNGKGLVTIYDFYFEGVIYFSGATSNTTIIINP